MKAKLDLTADDIVFDGDDLRILRPGLGSDLGNAITIIGTLPSL